MSGSSLSRLEEVRREFGYSRPEVARALGWSEKTVYRLERGLTPVRGKHLLALGAFYGVTAKDLRERERSAVA